MVMCVRVLVYTYKADMSPRHTSIGQHLLPSLLLRQLKALPHPQEVAVLTHTGTAHSHPHPQSHPTTTHTHTRLHSHSQD